MGRPEAQPSIQSDDTLATIPLGNLLSLLLPSPTQTLLLQACLRHDDVGWAAWQGWLQRVGDPLVSIKHDRDGSKRMLPLLCRMLSRRANQVDAELLTVLRTAYLRESLRSETFAAICRDVLLPLQHHKVPVLLLRGAALQQGVYPEAALRHCHDLDLLIAPGDRDRAARILLAEGNCRAGRRHNALSDLGLQHQSGLPIIIHSQPFRISSSRNLLADIWYRSEQSPAFGHTVNRMAITDMLLHICGHAALASSRTTGVWVSDAFHLLMGKSVIDWDALLAGAKRAQLTLPLSIMLDYLATAFELPLEQTGLGRIRDAAAQSGRVEQELALWGAFQGCNGDTQQLWHRAQIGYERRALRRWLLMPSLGFLYATAGRHPTLGYLVRPVRSFARRHLTKLAVG